jgi:rhodanese-related sulfurtransferase
MGVSERHSSGATSSAGYAGDLDPKESWDRLSRDPQAQLVDVRTEAEWNFVGVPDLGAMARQVLLCEWQRFPPASNPDFVQELRDALSRTNYAKGSALLFLCRSGARSRAAAIAMTAAGYGPCFNIRHGFEGATDDQGHRGGTAGWKADGLPWRQS